MAARTIAKESFSLGKTLHDEELMFRLPDYGPLDIKECNEYMKLAKEIFYKKWLTSQSTLDSASLTDFKTLQHLGHGSFGYVILGRHEPSQKYYAMKCMDKEKVIKHQQIENLKTEQLLLQNINFPFTIYLVCTLKDSCNIYFVLPFIEGRDLYRHLKVFRKCDEEQARFYTSQVILALEYLHYLDFVYRDLKPENVLIDHTGYLKLTDFGFTKHIKRRHRTYTLCGTPEYMAPEIILNKGYGKASDWWSVGIFIYELVTGQTPFAADKINMINKKIIAGKYKIPDFFSLNLRHLVDNLLQIDLSKRYGNLKNGVGDIKQHMWLGTVNWLDVLNRKIEAPYKPTCLLMDFEEDTHFVIPKGAKKDKYSLEFADF